MKVKNIFSLSIPVATCSLYWLINSRNTNKNHIGLLNVQACQGKLQLEQVQVLVRHGARTPFKNRERFVGFSNLGEIIWDKNELMKVLSGTNIDFTVKSLDGSEPPPQTKQKRKEILLGGCIPGELTIVGQKDAYDFGNWLAREYIDKYSFISTTFKNDEIYVRSTRVKRTIRTAVCLLAGLFGENNFTETVLIHTIPDVKKDDLIAMNSGCTNLDKRFCKHWGVPLPNQKDDQDAINTMMGITEKGIPFNFMEMYDIIDSRLSHGLYVPQYLLDNYELIEQHSVQMVLVICGIGNDAHIKNCIGSLLETLCCRIDDSIEGKCKNKMLIYATHQSTIMTLLIAMGIFKKHWPTYAANICLELYRGEDGERFIRVLYNGDVMILDKESGGEFLPVDKFMRLIEKYRVLDRDEDCGNKPN